MTSRLGMHDFTGNIVGFSQLGTGNQDYGQGIVRLDTGLVQELRTKGHNLRRNDLVRIENEKHDRLFATLRVANIGDAQKVGLEYDDRVKLGVEKQGEYRLYLRKAYRVETFEFFGITITLPCAWNLN